MSTAGERGDSGERGVAGERGAKGDHGQAGDQGANGPQGDRGVVGDRGETGGQGERGPLGDAGQTGPQGERGILGDQGYQGAQGAQGEKGDAGNPATRWFLLLIVVAFVVTSVGAYLAWEAKKAERSNARAIRQIALIQAERATDKQLEFQRCKALAKGRRLFNETYGASYRQFLLTTIWARLKDAAAQPSNGPQRRNDIAYAGKLRTLRDVLIPLPIPSCGAQP